MSDIDFSEGLDSQEHQNIETSNDIESLDSYVSFGSDSHFNDMMTHQDNYTDLSNSFNHNNQADISEIHNNHHSDNNSYFDSHNPEEHIQSSEHNKADPSFKGYGKCYRCACLKFEGDNCCSNCGHNYHDHW